MGAGAHSGCTILTQEGRADHGLNNQEGLSVEAGGRVAEAERQES